MGKIFYIMGKSSSGKDTIYSRLLQDSELGLSRIVLYTTRPMREGETEGKEYHFTDRDFYEKLQAMGKVIEARTYQTVYGPRTYFTADDGTLELKKNSYLGIGTLESYQGMREYYGEDKVVPVYVEVEDGERLKRAIRREEQQKVPKYEEMCRRFLADAEDFSEEKLRAADIRERFFNTELENCIKEIKNRIQKLQ